MIGQTGTLTTVWNEDLCFATRLYQREPFATVTPPRTALLQHFNANIPVLSEHWLTGMQLQRKDAIEQCSIFAVGEVENQTTIHKVLNVSSFGANHYVVPVIQIE